MVNTFKQMDKMYTTEEYKKVYDIVREYYEEDDIEDFILSTDVEEKDEFITDNDIESIRVCSTCGKLITEGYIYNDYETYCSDKCFIENHGKSVFDNADEDELFWTDWKN